MKTLTLNIRELKSLFGSSCKNVTVEWQPGVCGDINCEPDSTGNLVVSYASGCKDCLMAKVTCLDDCEGSKVRLIKICPCTTDEDCKDCEECGPDKYCISTCDEELCLDNGNCGECDDANPCPGDLDCVQNGCQCPPDKPYRKGDECFPCLPGSCPVGQECTPDGCVDIDCKDLVLDKTTGKCEECVGDGDCPGNKICEDKKCTCPPGFRENPVTKECEEIGCSTDNDCGNCESCDVKSGKCRQKQASPGYFIHPETCEIVKECDCSDPTCEDGGACIKASNGRCFCSTCTGNCADGCSKGCYCNKNTDKCEPNPCQGSCRDGEPCASGCVCDEDTKECRPCQGDECEDDSDCGDKIEGEVLDCADGCGLKTTLTLEEPCKCDSLTASTEVINVVDFDSSKFTIDTRIEIRKGVANASSYKSLSRLDDDSKADIAQDEEALTGSVSAYVQVRYNLLDENGLVISSSLEPTVFYPNGGFASIAGKGYVDISGINVPKIGHVYDENKVVLNVRVVFLKDNSWSFPNSCTYEGSQVIGSYLFSRNDTLLAALGASTQNYKLPRVSEVFTDDTRYPMFSYYRSDDSDYTENEIVRKEYIPPVEEGGSVYVDILYGPNDWNDGSAVPLDSGRGEGRLISNKHWLVKNDCACGDGKSHDYGKVNFCSPCNADGELEECAKVFALTAFDIPCHVNRDLTLYDDHTTGQKYVANHPSQVTWDLFLNDTKVGTIKHDGATNEMVLLSGGSALRDYKLPDGNGGFLDIESVRIVHKFDSSCTINIPVQSAKPRVTESKVGDCEGDVFLVVVPKQQVDGRIDSVVYVSGEVAEITEGAGSFTIKVPTGDPGTTVKYVFENGCEVVRTYSQDADKCCTLEVVSITRNSIVAANVPLNLEVKTTGGAGPLTYVWTKSIVTANMFDQPEGPVLVDEDYITTSDVLYTVTITDFKGCVAKGTYLLKGWIDKTIRFDFNSPLCGNATTDARVLYDDGDFGTVRYTILSGPNQGGGGLLSFGRGLTGRITGLRAGDVVSYNNLIINDVSFPDFSDVITIEGEPNSSTGLSISPSISTVCRGAQNGTLRITGPSGATVTLSSSGANPVNDRSVVLVNGEADVIIENTGNAGVNSYSVSGSSSGCVLATDSTSIIVSEGILASMTYECDGGVVVAQFNTEISRITDQNGVAMQLLTLNSVIIPTGVSQINVTPVGDCAQSSSFVRGTDWDVCDCEVYGISAIYKINSGVNQSYDPNTVISMAPNDSLIILLDSDTPGFTQCLGSWGDTPAGSTLNITGSATSGTLTNMPVGSHVITATINCVDGQGQRCTSETIQILVDVVQREIDVQIDGVADCFGDELIANFNIMAGVTYAYSWVINGDVDNPITTTNLDVSNLAPGQYQIDLKVTGSDGSLGMSGVFYTRGECAAANFIFLVDSSGSIDVNEWNSINSHITNMTTEIANKSNGSTFSVIKYNAANTVEVNASTAPVGTLSDSTTGSANIQSAAAWLTNTGIPTVLNLDGSLGIKVFILTDEGNQGIIGESVTDGFLAVNILQDTDNDGSDGIISAGFMEYVSTDALKAVVDDILIVRYPFNTVNSNPSHQARVDQALLGIVGGDNEKLYKQEFGQDPTSKIINDLNCGCSNNL